MLQKIQGSKLLVRMKRTGLVRGNLREPKLTVSRHCNAWGVLQLQL